MGSGGIKGLCKEVLDGASQDELRTVAAELSPEARAKVLAALQQVGSTTAASPLPPRPEGAVGTFLRMLTVNDVYVLQNYPKVASAMQVCTSMSSSLDCVVTSHLNGDFLSPCVSSALDSGKAMMEGLNQAKIQYACLGNHEFDLGLDTLEDRVGEYKGKLINSNCNSECCASLKRYDALKVGSKTVVFAGACTTDKNIYAASNMPEFTPLNDALVETWKKAKEEVGEPDAFVPMTHQLVHEDEATARALDEAGLSGLVPVILGGHEHEIFTPEVCGTRIVKMGQDASIIGVVDVWWDKDGKVRSSLTRVPAKSFDDDPATAAWVQKQEKRMNDLLEVPIMQLPWACSSEIVRFQESKLASLLMTMVKRGLRAEGVQLAMNQGGNFRGRAEYEAGPFTLKNLMTELPWDAHQAIIKVPGKVLVDTVRTMRSPDGEKPGFIHLDLDCEVGEGHELLKIDGEPVDPEKEYTIATGQLNLTGMDNIEPLMTHVKTSGLRVPDEEECLPKKQIVLSVCMKDAWRQLLGLGEWKPGTGSDLKKKELKEKVVARFQELDKDKSGFLSRAEIKSELEKQKLNTGLLERMIDDIDASNDDRVSVSELASVVQ